MSFSAMRQSCAAGCFNCSADIAHTPQCAIALCQTSHLNVVEHYEHQYNPFSRTLNGLQSPYPEDNVQHHTSPVTRPQSAKSDKVWHEVKLGCPPNCVVCNAGEVHVAENYKAMFMGALTKGLKGVERQREREEKWQTASPAEWEMAEFEKPLLETDGGDKFMGRPEWMGPKPEWMGPKPEWRKPVYLEIEYEDWELPEQYESEE